MPEDTDQPTASSQQADDRLKPPDHLKLRGPDDDDSKFVTEELARMSPLVHYLLASWFVLLGALSIVHFVCHWPEQSESTLEMKLDSLMQRVNPVSDSLALSQPERVSVSVAERNEPEHVDSMELSVEVKNPGVTDLFLIVLFAGILGGSTHGLASLMDFRGQRRLFRSWSLWYFGLPLVGGMMAVIFFIVLRAGLFPDAQASGILNPYGIAALGVIVGMFSDKATNKLAAVADTMFSTSEKYSKAKERDGELDASIHKTEQTDDAP